MFFARGKSLGRGGAGTTLAKFLGNNDLFLVGVWDWGSGQESPVFLDHAGFQAGAKSCCSSWSKMQMFSLPCAPAAEDLQRNVNITYIPFSWEASGFYSVRSQDKRLLTPVLLTFSRILMVQHMLESVSIYTGGDLQNATVFLLSFLLKLCLLLAE